MSSKKMAGVADAAPAGVADAAGEKPTAPFAPSAPAKKDSRLNASILGWRPYLALLLIIFLVLGAHSGLWLYIFTELPFQEILATDAGLIAIATVMVAYILVSALILMLVFSLVWRHYVQRPVEHLCDAARAVTAGDFSVRLESGRKDGKVDELEVLYQDFNVMVAELASTELLKTDFVSNVSHELKTPLAVINNYATMLQSDGLTVAERHEYARTVADAAARLSAMVTSILQLNRLEHQNIAVRTQPYNLSEQLSRCILGFEQVWEEKDIELDVDLDQDVIVDADEDLLDTVWNNLISNALKFTEPGGTVSVHAGRDDDGRVVVRVSDTGCGMDEVTARHVFDKFYQGDTSHATQGNGLGLALVKRILELLGGDVTVDSAPGSGSTFTVTL